ncbi:CoA ester lyase [Halobacteria archaeon AArc-m2/3/4]|uniref:CoA ester lyase n=1 Tax=Natronoglomus mannanivorans TaxID=2979990 RepID=A0ABT2QC32_9EURY|nr:CoA ester lyase [Halobacteria archaeon AArc-m2/3/4]
MSRRSVLFTPGDRPDMLRKAPRSGADVVVFDLEDAVAPARTDDARAAVREVLSDPAFDPGCEVCVRVNPGERAIADLEALLESSSLRFDGVVLPKVSAGVDVERLSTFLTDRDRTVPVFALIETARGVLAADEIAAVPATDALVFGAEDLAADVGASRTPEGTEVVYARQRVVLAAAAHGCTAIDTLHTDFEDEAGLREDTAVARQFGYDGKLAIHPAQIEPIHDAFTPSEADVAWAERVLEARRAADADGRGVFEVDGEMIDQPLIERAERVLELASETDAV